MIRKWNWRNTYGSKAIATVLSAAMAFSGLSAATPAATAFAEEGEDELIELIDETEDLELIDDSVEIEEDSFDEFMEEASDEASSADTVVPGEGEPEAPSREFDENKTDVWDFGAEDLGEKYNNRLDADTINSFYKDVTPGTTGVALPSFSVDDGDFVFESAGATNHRYRTTNTALTRYDEKSLKDSDGNVFSGYIYSNKGKTDAVYLAVECKTDDIITAYVASNGTDSEIHFQNMTDKEDETVHVHTLGSSVVSKMVSYPANDAQYKFYSATEKLVVARVYREHAKYGILSGKVEGFEGTGSFDLVFTNVQNGNVVKATVSDGNYTAKLAEGFDYNISLEGADAYVVTSGKSVNIEKDTEMNVTVSQVELVNVSGKITGISEEDVTDFVAGADFTFTPDDKESVFVPEISLTKTADGIEYDLMLQKDVTYAVSVADKADTQTEKYAIVDNYDLKTTELKADKDSSDVVIALEAKPVYKVTIAPSGATLSDLAEAVFTFTRLDVENDFVADGYVYEFKGTDNIALRDGQYVVEVSNAGAYVQKLTTDLVVKGADVTKEIAFSSDITEWDFSDAAFAAKCVEQGEGGYNGLTWTNAKAHQNTYLYSGAGKISVPVKGDCQIQVTGNYQYSYYFVDETEPSFNVKTGSTSQNDTFTYDYKGAAGTVDITVAGQSYLTKIATVYQTEYKAELLVGASEKADFATINEALAAVRLMDRKDGERVTIKVEPGNYEEMLVVDVPNVTLANASATPSNTLKNKGVDIDENAVRVTWYYGHGYTYYSMNSAYKYDAEVLATNKANGYTTVINPGSGTATYWNASVVVDAAGFEAKDIIFENSFNQYMSQKATEDVIVPQSGAKEGSVARNTMAAGDVTVQDKKYVERAAALALTGSATEAYFENCRIIGRQDTLYGHEKTTAAFYNCAVYGGTDFIFGAMTAVFAKCDLVLNTSEDKNDVAYITAPQQKSASTRGYLMYNCTVKSTTPGEDTASLYTSKPGQFGRPWQANTSEVVFFDTVVEKTSWELGADGKTYTYKENVVTSLIQPAGWNTSLGGESARNVEYGTFEVSGVNNKAARVAWVQQPETAVTADGKAISVSTFLGEWDPFTANSKDMTISFPDGTSEDEPVAPEPETPTPDEPSEPTNTSEFVLESSALTAFAAGSKADGDTEKAGTEDYFTLIYSAKSKIDGSAKTWEDDYTSPQRINFGGVASTEKNSIKFTTSNSATVKIWWVQGGDDNRQMAILDASGAILTQTEGTYTKNSPYISTLKVDAAGTYYLGGATNNNNIYKVVVTEDVAAEPTTYSVESLNLTAFAAGAKADGDTEKAGTDDYFTLIYSAKSKIDASAKTWEDDYTSPQRINFGGVASTEKNSIKFTTSGAATVKVWWVQGGDDNHEMGILDAAGTLVAVTSGTYTKNSPYISTLELAEAGTYFLGGATNNNNIYKVEVTEGSAPVEVKRAEWETVAAPVVKSVALDETNANNVVVTVASEIGLNGGDSLAVTMFDAEGKEVKTLSSTAAKTEFTFTFSPAKSGKYTFSATLSREDEETVKTSEVSEAFEFVLPLVTPEFKNVVNQGKGNVKVNFYSVPEATGYVLTATDKTDAKKKPVEKKFTLKDADTNDSTEYSHVFKGLKVGDTYEITLVAVRGDEKTEANKLEVKVTKETETEWVFSAFGTGVTKGSNAGYTANEDGTVTVWNTGNKGKLVPASTDGLAFYYTAVPTNKNFTLTAKATIDTWTFTNGQEGFGLMAADRVGVNGDSSTFWNNSYMATATKVEYYYDKANHAVTNVDTADKISMKLGLGSQEKIGVTPSNLERLEANDSAAVKEFFSSKMRPLETSCGEKGVGTYNLFGKEASGTVKGTIENPLTEVTLRIQKNNTGYFVSYIDGEGNVLKSEKYYDTKALNKLDSKYVYVGFFAARTFKVTFSNIELKVIDPSKDAKAEPKETTFVEPNYKVISAEYSNTAKYELRYTGNADGVLTITDETGFAVVDREKVKSGAVKKVNVRLENGNNPFTVTFTPNKNFNPGGDKYKKLSSYETATFVHNVKFQTVNNSEKIYVSPKGSATADGSAEAPVDIYTAVKYVKPGQTIVLEAGTYSLKETVIVERGIDGTLAQPITMIAENGRAIFDFNSACAGFILAGDYWHIKGIDCTKSGNSEKGIQVSGSHITLEDIRTYENGNTGIQVSRYLGSDKRADWPSYDLILNCTSFANADAGYEDADGFAAKLTCGDGIVFDGCISYNNADDGWDLFAKVENGSIGQVTIQNCVAFANGYGVDVMSEGNGNGFKMGGESMPGAHKLINSVAWGNKAKGIDSNSGPDIQVYNCMSFNNGANNVALYTNDAANTNYLVNGVISYRTTGKETNENFKLRGTQDESRVFGKNNFFWTDGASKNADGLTVSDDWFVSLDAPKADVKDAYAVAAAMRTADGRIDLGNFMKLTDKATEALAAAGVDASVAALNGAYTAVADEREIAGSDNDAYQSIEGFTVDNFKSKVAYTGKKLTQNFVVYYGADLLKEGADYKVSYKNNVNVGTATVTITGKGAYTGKTVETFRIVPADIKDASVTVKSVKATGKESKGKYPKVKATVVYMGKTLKAGRDYTIEVDWAAAPQAVSDASGKETVANSYPVVIKGLGNFSGENKDANVKVYLKGKKIAKEDKALTSLKGATLTLSAKTFEFTGSPVEPEVTVSVKGNKLDADKYTVQYSANVNKGTAKVTVDGIESKGYTGTLSMKFAITATDVKNLTISVAESAEYVKGGVKAPVEVKLGERTLREGVDYKLAYSSNTKVGQKGKVKVTGLGNFKGSAVESFAITTADISKAAVVVTDKAVKKNIKGMSLISKPVVYGADGKALKANTDYTVKYFYGENEITKKTVLSEGAATIKVVVTGKNSYTGEKTATYQVRELKNLSKVKAEKIATQKFTGKAVRPDGQLKLYTVTGTGKKAVKTYLQAGTDFEVVGCYNNVKQGTAKYVLKGTGAFSGYKTVTFKIAKAATK